MKQEYRIGSLVDLGNRFAKMIEIGTSQCTVVDLEETQDTIESWDRIKPVPITKEILEKLGFEVKIVSEIEGFNTWYYRKYIAFENYENDYYYAMTHTVSVGVNIDSNNCSIWNESDDEMGANTKRKIMFVHQLQNLWYELTEEELDITQITK